MIVLLDENLPHNLRHALPGHDVSTVFYRGWAGYKNGELVTVCEQQAIDVLVTADQGMAYQQNMTDRRLALVILPTNEPHVLEQIAKVILQAVESAEPGSYRFVTLDERF